MVEVIAWLLVPLILAALVYLARRRSRLIGLAPREEGQDNKVLVRDRSPEHQAVLDMAQAWLCEPSIQRALVKTRAVSVQWLEETNGDLGHLDEGDLYATVGVLTRDRRVRQVIARYHMKRFPGTTQFEAMHELIDLHEQCSGKKSLRAM